MKTTLSILCVIYVISAGGADKIPSEKKTSLTDIELRTLATSVPDTKTASMLHSVAMATSNNIDLRQEYLKAAAACLIACDKKDVYVKHIKSKLLNVEEFESGLKDDCKQCSGEGTKDRRCSVCNGKGKCTSCKGSGQTASYGFDRPKEWKTCRKCNGNGQCGKCEGNGSNKEKCIVCAGTGKTFSKTVAARVYRDLCNSIADGMATEANSKAESVKRGHKRIKEEARAEVMAEKQGSKRMTVEASAKVETAECECNRIEDDDRAKREAEDRKRKRMEESQGEADNLLKKGFAYYLGSGVLQDYYRALEYFNDASELGCIEADCVLSQMYLNGIGCERNEQNATKSFIHAKKAEMIKDSASAELVKNVLGTLYLAGFYDPDERFQKDSSKAYAYFNACKTHGDALFIKGLMEYYGIGTVKNATKAAETFFTAIKTCKEDSPKGRACMCLGQLYYKGEGVAQNRNLAWQLLRKGAQAAFPQLIRAAKAPLTNFDIANFNSYFGQKEISLWTPFSWKMYNLYKGIGSGNLGGVEVDLLQRALMTLFNPDCWSLTGIEYNFDDM